MSRGIVDGLLVLLGGITILVWVFNQLKDFIQLERKEFFTFKRFKYPLILLLIIGLSLYLVNSTSLIPNYNLSRDNISNYQLYCWIIAFFVSMIWLQYILKLDNKKRAYMARFLFIYAIDKKM